MFPPPNTCDIKKLLHCFTPSSAPRRAAPFVRFVLICAVSSRYSYLTDANFQHQTTSGSGGGASSGTGSAKTADPDFWMDRLNHLISKANLNRNADGISSAHAMHMDNKVADENLNLNSMNAQQKMSSLIRRDTNVRKKCFNLFIF